jgi:4-hydroxy-tetrahydrodipicolinate reductase
VDTPIRVALAGATGRTGREVARAIADAPDLALVAALGHQHAGEHLGRLIGRPDLDVRIVGAMEDAAREMPSVLVDFTEPASAHPRLLQAVAWGWSIVVGTTGFSREQRGELAQAVAEHQVGAALIANFSIGAWVSEHLALEASRYFSQAEVTEAHHHQKKDRPSGTALRMAGLLAKAWRREPDDIPVHSIRLPGMVAHQTVIFGAAGQVLTIRHDVHDRTAYAAGVLAAVRRMNQLRGRLVDDLGEVLKD